MFKKLFLISLLFIRIDAWASLMPDEPELNSIASITVDHGTGEILQSNNKDLKLPMASVTKVMTAFVVFSELDKGTIKLTDQVKVSKNAWQKNGSSMFIEVGKNVLLEDLIKGLLVHSGNDAAIALSEHISGSEDAFAKLMNKYAMHIGMKNSNFKNATGLHHKDHYSTAFDLSILGRELINKYPEKYAYFSIKEFEFNNIMQKNRNKLIQGGENQYDGFKTGYTSNAKYCLMASAKYSERRVIVVILGADTSKKRFNDARVMTSYGLKFFENYELKTTNEKNDFLIKIPSYYTNKDFLEVELNGEFLATLPRGSKSMLDVLVDIPDKIIKPVKKGEKIGSVKIRKNGEIIKEIEIVAKHNLIKSGKLSYIADYIALNWLN